LKNWQIQLRSYWFAFYSQIIQVTIVQKEISAAKSSIALPIDTKKEIECSEESAISDSETDLKVSKINSSKSVLTKASEQNLDLGTSHVVNSSDEGSKPEVLENQHDGSQNPTLELVDSGHKAVALYDYQACKLSVLLMKFYLSLSFIVEFTKVLSSFSAADDEISFDPDDIITHIEMVSGWKNMMNLLIGKKFPKTKMI